MVIRISEVTKRKMTATHSVSRELWAIFSQIRSVCIDGLSLNAEIGFTNGASYKVTINHAIEDRLYVEDRYGNQGIISLSSVDHLNIIK